MLARTTTLLLFGLMIAGTSTSQAADDKYGAGDTGVRAINVLLVPDEAMSARAAQINKTLRTNYPQGFALDASHVPHISLLHRFVKAKDLWRALAAVDNVTARHALVGRELTAKGFEHSPWEGHELSSIGVEKTPELTAVQAELIEALRPYSVDAAGPEAFVTTPDAPQVDAATVDYVKTFVEKRTGENFKPHITVGLSDRAAADRLQSQAVPMKFKVAAVAVYELGNVGTARKELWRSAQKE